MHFKTVPVSDLIIDKRYQRELDKKRVKQIVENFNPRLLGTLDVSTRNGKSAVFDGQHRLAALKALKMDAAPCLSHDDLTPEQEAELFVALQRDRRTVNAVERFKARVFSHEPVACELKGIVEECGYTIATHLAANQAERGQIRAVATLERIFNRGGEGLLAQTLELAKTWDGDARSTDAMFLDGLSILVAQYGDRIDAEAVSRLGEIAPTVILRRATNGLTGGGGVTAARLVAVELRKVSGVRGRPASTKKAPVV